MRDVFLKRMAEAVKAWEAGPEDYTLMCDAYAAIMAAARFLAAEAEALSTISGLTKHQRKALMKFKRDIDAA